MPARPRLTADLPDQLEPWYAELPHGDKGPTVLGAVFALAGAPNEYARTLRDYVKLVRALDAWPDPDVAYRIVTGEVDWNAAKEAATAK